MNELTSNMKPVCFGRYVIDVPQKAEVALGFARSDSSDIESVEPPRKSQQAFRNFVAMKEQELRAEKHETEGSRLRGTYQTEDGDHILVYRESSRGHFISVVEAHVWRDGSEWTVGHAISDEDIEEFKKEVMQITSHLVPRSPNSTPTEPGACLRNGILNIVPTEGEEFAGGARMEDLSWTLSFRSETSKPYAPDERLIKRAEDAIGMAGGASSGIKVLRKREMNLDGRKGEEIVALYPGDGVASFDAKLELYGDGTYKVPTIKLNMAAGRLSPPDPNDKRQFLSDDEALALWDALLMSIRPRPGAF